MLVALRRSSRRSWRTPRPATGGHPHGGGRLTEGQKVVKSAEVCGGGSPFERRPISAGIRTLFMRANHDEKQVMVEVLESLMGSLDGPTEWGHAGKVFRFAGNYARALDCHEQALKLVVETEGRASAAYADLSSSMSSTLDDAGRYEEAIRIVKKRCVWGVALWIGSEEVAGSCYRMGWFSTCRTNVKRPLNG